MALVLGHSLWIALLAYMLGGMLGLSFGLIWGLLCERFESLPGLGLYRRQQQEE